MFSRLKRTALAFLAVLAAFGTYRLVVVPLIDPPLEESRVAKTDSADLTPLTEQNRLGPYLRFFPAGSWERQNPMVMESDTTKVVIGDYKVGNGRDFPQNCVRFQPCTLILLPDGEFDVDRPDARRRIVILQAKQATLKFAEDIDISKMQLSNLTGGNIPGEVTIFSPPTRPDGGDDLRIVARDLELAGNKITSAHPVNFRFGESHGTGDDLTITLLPGKNSGGPLGPGIGGIQDFTLDREVQMHLQPGEAGFIPGDDRAAQKKADRNLPIDIRCTGPFTFDLVAYIAEFHDNVVMLRPNPPGRDDRLTAALVSVFFAERELTPTERARKNAAKSPDPAAGEPIPDGQKMPRLVPQKFKARGAPVVLDAPSNQVYAVGDEMEYDRSTGRISLKAAEGAKPVYLKIRDENEAEARTLHYQQAPTGRLIGQLYSDGPGWLRARPDEKSDDEIIARWEKKVVLRPDQNEHLLWIVGHAHVEYTDTGLIDAPEICLWLNELSADVVSPGAIRSAATSDQIRARVRPARLLAIGDAEKKSADPDKRLVHFESRQLDGDMDELRAWFRATGSNPNALANRPPRDPNRRRSPNEPRQRAVERDKDHYQVSCRAIEAGIALDGSRSEIQWAKLVDSVSFHQTPEKMGDPPPLSIHGDWLSLSDANTSQEHVTVAGQLANIKAQDMTMRGATVQLDRGSRRLWIDGPGEMLLPPRQQAAGQFQPVSASSQPRDALAMSNRGPLTVQWKDGMNFDGHTIALRGSVVAKQVTADAEQSIRNELLKVTLRGQVDFSDTRQRQQQLEVELVEAPGHALLEHLSYHNGQPLTVDRMWLTDLVVNQITGEVRSAGPGIAKSWRYGPRQDLSATLPASRGPVDPTKPDAVAKPDENQINYSQVEFQNGVGGNVLENQRSITFNDRVRAMVGPVPDWQTELADESSQPGKMVLHCDQLTVAQPPRISNEAPSTNVVAVGNTHIEGTGERGELFSADGYSLKYDQAKDQVRLVGDGRTPAQAFRQERIGAERTHVSGTTLVGSRKSGRFNNFSGQLQHIDGSMLTPQPAPRTSPAPQPSPPMSQ
ncbi:MAG: hypothetical protein IT427_13110 [Pirellulales bacterium]|nr:hypothetical protein [Pirellulales bacterium]